MDLILVQLPDCFGQLKKLFVIVNNNSYIIDENHSTSNLEIDISNHHNIIKLPKIKIVYFNLTHILNSFDSNLKLFLLIIIYKYIIVTKI